MMLAMLENFEYDFTLVAAGRHECKGDWLVALFALA
jgi:hypothetical protein